MKLRARTIRPPVKWHGGKHYLAHRIIELFPEHDTYVEPFGGAASVLLNKVPAPVEIYNDLDGRITRLFRVLRDHGDEMRRRLTLTPYSEAEFEDAARPRALARPPATGGTVAGSLASPQGEEAEDDEIEQARRDFVRWRQSLGGRSDAFSFTLHRVRRGMADVVSGYLSAIDIELPNIIERLRRVQILQRPAVEVIRKWDSPTSLIYCDPPYVHATRTSQSVYAKEMGDKDHRELAKALRACEAKVVVSGYESPLYNKLFDGWHTKVFELPNNAAGGKSKARMREVLWLNWEP